MTILEGLKNLFGEMSIPVETLMLSDPPKGQYVVLTPGEDRYLYRDDKPKYVISNATISLFQKWNYIKTKNNIVKELISNGYTITDTRFVEFDVESGYYHYSIDVEKSTLYEQEEL